MKFRLSGLDRFQIPLAAFFLLLIPFGLYFFFYVGHQEQYYTHRNVRDLAVISRQIRERVDSYRRVLQNRADYVGDLLTPDGETRQSLDERNCMRGDLEDKEASSGTNNIQRVQACFVEPYIENRVPGLSYVSPADGKLLREEVTLRRGDDGFELNFLAKPKKTSAGEAFRIHAKTSLRRFGDQFTGHGEFDSILLLDGDGTVLYQSEHAELRATKIPTLAEKGLTAATGVQELTLGDVDYLAFTQPVDLIVATLTAAEPAGASRSGTNRRQDGSGEQTEEAKPRAARPDPTARQQLAVCGLVAKGRFVSEAQAISYSVVIWFVFFLAMLTFLAPYLKLRFLAPTERLPRWEGLKLLVATLLGAAAISVCILDVYYYERLVAEVDESLVGLADRMEKNFSEEIDRAYLQLVDYDRGLSDSTARDCGGKESVGAILSRDEINSEIYPYLSLIFWADTAGEQKIKWSVNKEPTTFVSVGRREYFRRVRDHDRSIRELPSLRTAEGNVGRFWLESLFSWTTGSSEVVISTSVRTRGCSDSEGEPLQMVAGILQPLSVTEPVLPPGYGFAVVDSEGRVLLHSDKQRVLTENFFTESDEERELRSAVQGGIPHTMAIRYFGKDHRAHVRPLDNLQGLAWSLIVLHPMKPLRTLNLEVLTLTAVLFGVYLVVLLLMIWWTFAGLLRGLLWFLDPGKALSLLWPSKKKIGIYRRLCAFYAVTAVLFLVWIAISTGLILLVGSVLIPLYAFLYGLLGDRFRGEFHVPGRRWTWLRRSPVVLLIPLPFVGWSEPHLVLCVQLFLAAFLLQNEAAERCVRWALPKENLKPYIVRLTAAIVVLGVLPGIAFFKFGYRLERHLWQMYSQQEIVEALQVRSARVRNYYHSLLPKSSERESFLSRRLHGDNLDVYAGFDGCGPAKSCGVWSPCVNFNACKEDFAALTSADGRWDGDARELFQPARPLYDDFAGQTWPLLTPSSSVRMVRDDGGRRWIHTLAADESVEIRSPAASMRLGFGRPEFAAFLAWLLLLYALHWGLRFIARVVFLIDLPAPEPRQAELGPEKAIRGNLFIFGHPRSGKTEGLRDRDDIHLVDIALSDGELGALPLDKAVAIDQFEYQMDDPVWNQKKLKMLEDLVYRRAKDEKVTNSGVVIVSTIDPIFYLSTGGSGKPAKNGEKPDLGLDRWANVLGSFEVYDFEDWTRGDLKQALEKFSLRCTPVGETRDVKRRAEEVAKICRFLDQECRWTAPLRKAALEVVPKIDRTAPPSRKELADQIYDRCEAYYRSIWSACSKAEKRMLIQLAEEGVLNRKDERVVRHLMKKGLIDRRPRLRLRNDSFHRFILNVREEEDFRSWERRRGARLGRLAQRADRGVGDSGRLLGDDSAARDPGVLAADLRGCRDGNHRHLAPHCSFPPLSGACAGR